MKISISLYINPRIFVKNNIIKIFKDVYFYYIMLFILFILCSINYATAYLGYNRTVSEAKFEHECQLIKYLQYAGFPAETHNTMICIAKYESGLNCGSKNRNMDGSTSYGLFQINSNDKCNDDISLRGHQCKQECYELYKCQLNTDIAYEMWKEDGFNAWYGYNRHREECNNYISYC